MFFFSNGIFAIDFAQIESVITQIERDTGLEPANGWIVVVSEEFSVGPKVKNIPASIDESAGKNQTEKEQIFEDEEDAAREIPRFYNKGALRPLTSVKKLSLTGKLPNYADIFFGDTQPEFVIDEEEVSYESPRESVLQDKIKENRMEPFKNRRRPKRRLARLSGQQKPDSVSALNSKPVSENRVLPEEVDKVDDRVFLDRLAGKIRAIVCN